MQGKQTQALKAYLNPRKSRADRDVMARLLADNAHGKGTSAVIRTALAEHYGLEERRPAPAPDGALEALTAEVAALRQTVAQMAALFEQQVNTQALEIARLQVALIALAYGDRPTQRNARALAATLTQCAG